MLTRCPDCATGFRVREEQLQVAEGSVRCGRCDCVFDARMHSANALAASGHAPSGDSALVMAHQPVPDTADTATETVTVLIAPTHSGSPRWKRALGGGVVLLLLLALGLQGLWWQRQALAAHPEGLQLVQLLCRFAPCSPRPPKALEHIEVLERGLDPHPDRPDALRFHLRMVNRAQLAQPYPLVELRLLDGLQRLAGVRRFTPAQYLTADGDGILAPDTPTDIDLELISPGDHVSGFQLDFF